MGNNPISTAVDAISDNRTYYNCPRCGERVWAYGAFVGNVCLDCPGTVTSAVLNTTSMATFGATKPIVNLHSGAALEDVAPVFSGKSVASAEFRGKEVWSISKGSTWNGLSADNQKEKICWISTKSCGIASGALSNSGVDHWWTVIRTNNGYYQIQFKKSGSKISIRKCDDESQCDECGLAEASRYDHVKPVEQARYSLNSVSGRKLGDLTNWISNDYNSNYNLFFNNCQDLCKKIYQWM